MDMYWPQHKVFFLATLALFPEKLVNQTVEPLFYWAYFGPIANAVGSDYDESDYEYFNTRLFYYQKDGYLTYKQATDGLYKIKSVNSQKAKSDLLEYLKKWQSGQLSTEDDATPPDISYQKELFAKALSQAKKKHQSKPRIKLSDIFGDPSELGYEVPFWELVLSYQVIDSTVLLEEIGYKSHNGLYYKGSQPYADIKITGQELLKAVELYQQDEAMVSNVARIGMNNHTLYIELNSTKRVMKNMRADSDPEKFINYLLNHTNTPTARNTLILDGKTSFSELARGLGFDDDMKKKFFTTMSKTTVSFTKEAIVSQTLADSIKKRFEPME
jgi:hypothetical protein